MVIDGSKTWVMSASAGVVLSLLALFSDYRPDVLAIFAVGFLLHTFLHFSVMAQVLMLIAGEIGRIKNIADSYDTNWEAVRDDVQALKEWRIGVDEEIRRLKTK